MSKYTRTTIENGVRRVTCFRTGELAIERALEMLAELNANNEPVEAYCQPAVQAAEALQLLLDRMDLPKHRTTATREGDPKPGK